MPSSSDPHATSRPSEVATVSRPRASVVCALDLPFDDLTPQSTALACAADLAGRSGGRLHLVHVVSPGRRPAPGVATDADVERSVAAFVNLALGAAGAFDILDPVVHRAEADAPADGVLAVAGLPFLRSSSRTAPSRSQASPDRGAPSSSA